jgi:hypothetical protein
MKFLSFLLLLAWFGALGGIMTSEVTVENITKEARGVLKAVDQELAKADAEVVYNHENNDLRFEDSDALTFQNYEPEFEFVIRAGEVDLDLKNGNTMTDAVRIFLQLANEKKIAFTCADGYLTTNCAANEVLTTDCDFQLTTAAPEPPEPAKDEKDEWAVTF